MIPSLSVTAIFLAFILIAPAIGKCQDHSGGLDLSPLIPILDRAIDQKKCPGAVVIVGTADGKRLGNVVRGHKSLAPTTRPMTEDAIFDMASLTKPMATALSVMVLFDRGLIGLDDPIAMHIAGFDNNGKESITIRQCLLHTAGFVPDNPMSDYVGTRQEMVGRILTCKPRTAPGEKFAYSDVGFIVLGELVQAVSKRPLDALARDEIFIPLKMNHTRFMPPAEWRDRFVPTEQRKGDWMLGEVHDPRAYALGGVAGHAGLFSTTDDVARFARMILNGGELDGVRIVRAETIAEMTRPQRAGGEESKAMRTLGFDNSSSYSSPRGAHFSAESFGHTGWTGTSLWIDPARKCFVILLTSRVHPDGKGDVKQLRFDIATAAAEALEK